MTKQSPKRYNLELAPVDMHAIEGLGDVYLDKREYDRAIEQFESERDVFERGFTNYLGLAYAYKGMYEKAIEETLTSLKMEDQDPDLFPDLAYIYGLSDRKDKAFQHSPFALKLHFRKQPVPAFYFALVYIGLGDKDHAFEALNQAFDQHTLMRLGSVIFVPQTDVDQCKTVSRNVLNALSMCALFLSDRP